MKYKGARHSVAVIAMIFFSLSVKAQYAYTAHQNELIFSLAEMNNTAVSSSPVVRFSGFLNYETQLHVDFSKTMGIYTALGIKNIGIINHFENKGINLKQRAYALGIPLALKMGSMKNKSYIAVGGEINLMTHYKQKFLYGDTKIKQSEWFSGKLNLLNPAVFLQMKFMKNQVITVKYFLKDFLRYQTTGLNLPDGTLVTDYGRSSKLFYISWGMNIAPQTPEVKKQKQKEQEQLKTARWVE